MAGDYGYDYEARQPDGHDPRVNPPGKGRLRRFGGFLSAFLTLCLVVAVVGGVGIFYLKSEFEAPGRFSEDTQFSVISGQGLTGIARELETRGFISDYRIFVAGVLAHDAKSKLKAGEYLLPKEASMQRIMNTLVSGRSVQHKVTIPEGMTSLQAVARLRKHPILTGEIEDIPPEGSLLPDTYVFLRGVNRNQLIRRMREAQQKAIDKLWETRKPGLPVKTKQEAIILASIVEKETAKAGERPHVASVFVNRLRKGIRLQSDPTIIYGIVGGKGILDRPLLRSDISRKTPYNTYQISALPPTPIANPGYAAIEAVLNPLETKDLYFVADGTGGHAFATTLAGHNRNVAKWRKIEAKRRSLAASKAALARKENAKEEEKANAAKAVSDEATTPTVPPAPPTPPSADPTSPDETGTVAGRTPGAVKAAEPPTSEPVPASPKPEIAAPDASSAPVEPIRKQAAVTPERPPEIEGELRPAVKAFPIPIPRPKPVRQNNAPAALSDATRDADAKPAESENRAAAPVSIPPPSSQPLRRTEAAPKSRFNVLEPDR